MVQFETRVESPLPGGIDAVVRFLFNLPTWFQIGGALVGAAVALWIAWRLWRDRRVILAWLRTRERRIQLTLAGAAALVVVIALGTGAASWNYMQHENGFCVGCHVMTPAYLRFNQPQKHDSLECHACHQQSLWASTRQLVVWVVEKPERIPAHGKLPNTVCERCHVTGEGREKWQRIASTAGHRTHLESGDSALRDVRCTTCHGFEIHHFAPVDSTCAQGGCHLTSETHISLGKMAGQTSLHCVMCHEFTADVPRLATRDSAAATLRPALKQCLGCHEMKEKLADFDPERDPHHGSCGTCHNPHTQKTPAAARLSCAQSGCHDSWRKVAFHAGAAHRGVAARPDGCVTCHQPHAARVDASDCAGCHASVRAAGKRTATPPLPFDTTRALKQTTLREEDPPPRGKGDAPAWPAPVDADSFSHSRHQSLACITCHTTTSKKTTLTFEPPRGCQICHHQAPARNECATCHDPGEIPPTYTATLRVARSGPPATERTRPVVFRHATHANVGCGDCHTTPVSLAPPPEVASCTACHDQHQAAGRDCAGCHRSAESWAAHSRPAQAHANCAGCHPPATIAALTPTRSFCLGCHPPAVDHYAERECTTCHFFASPAEYRARLVSAEERR